MRSHHLARLKVQSSVLRLDVPKRSGLNIVSARVVLPVRWERTGSSGVRIVIKVLPGPETLNARQTGGSTGGPFARLQ